MSFYVDSAAAGVSSGITRQWASARIQYAASQLSDPVVAAIPYVVYRKFVVSLDWVSDFRAGVISQS